MTIFHRNSANPVGYDPFPSGYDFINSPASNSPPGLGSPAPFDGKKSGGPNDGTYLFAFGEDVTSFDLNRGPNALADNCDTLDNYLRRPIALPTRTTDVTPGSPVTTITLPGPPSPPTVLAAYLGTTGQDSFPETLLTLFDVLDSHDDEIINPGTGIRTVVTSITSTSGGDHVGSGFAVGTITLHLNQAIPTGQTYRVYYGEKGNLATMGPDALTIIKVRGAMEVPAPVEDIFAQITNPGTVPEVVTALVATHFATPSNGRLLPSPVMFFDLDPNDSGATIRSFFWTTRINTGSSAIPLSLDDDPTGTLFPTLTGRAQIGGGMVWDAVSTFYMSDTNVRGGTIPDLIPVVPLSSPNATDGDFALRVFESLPVFGIPSLGPSLIKMSNARFACTVGDGTNSFGDFNGTNALENALAYLSTQSISNAYIQVKKGVYTLTSSHNLFMGGLVIEGAGSNLVTINLNIGSGAAGILFNPVITAVPVLLRVSGVTFNYSANASHGAIETVQYVSLYMRDVGFVNTTVLMTNPTIFGNVASFIADRCAFIQTTGPRISVDFQMGLSTGAINPEGFFFNGCCFNQANETQPVRFHGIAATSGLTVKRVFFEKCRYVLGGTATTSSAITHNTGVLEIDPNGFNNTVSFTDINFIDCSVQSVTTLANGPVARIYGLSLGSGGLAHKWLINSVTIRGGAWSAINSSTTGTFISPVLIAAQFITIEDVTFLGNLVNGGGPQPDDQFIVDDTVYGIHDWAQFIFAPGSFLVQQQTLEGDAICLTARNVAFRFLPQSGDSGDVWFFLGNTTNISNTAEVDGVTLCDFTMTGNGSRPNARMKVTVAETQGAIRDVSIYGANATNSNPWTTGVSGSSGFFVIAPTTGQSSQKVLFDSITIDGIFVQVGVTPDDGICIFTPSSGSCTFYYTLLNCRVRGMNRGVINIHNGNTNPLDNFEIIGGDFNFNKGPGIDLEPDIMGAVRIRGVNCIGNGLSGSAYAILVNPQSWQNSHQESVHITDNYCRGPGISISSVQCFIGLLSNNSGDHVTGFCHGNTCVDNSGNAGGIHVQDGAFSALPSPAQLRNQVFIEGVETGLGTSPNFTYTTASLMMRNLAALVTP
jgi:hypothetical protein